MSLHVRKIANYLKRATWLRQLYLPVSIRVLPILFVTLITLVFIKAPYALAQANDVSAHFEYVGNPYAARYAAPIPVSIRAFATYKSSDYNNNKELLYISGGATNLPGDRGDIWSLDPLDNSFRKELSQGDIEQTGIFRVLGNQLYLTNEDDINFQNFYRLDSAGWTRYGSNKSGSGHSNEAYLYDRLIHTLRRGDMGNPNLTSSVDNGATWNINPPVPVGSMEADTNPNEMRFFELNNSAYALGSECPHLLRRFDPSVALAFRNIPVCTQDSTGNYSSPIGLSIRTQIAPVIFKKKVVFISSFNQGLTSITQVEPSLVYQTNIGPANIMHYLVRDGVLYALTPITGSAGYYSVMASTDLNTFVEVFRFKIPSSASALYQFAYAGGNFYFSTQGQAPNYSGEHGKIYRVAAQYFTAPQGVKPPNAPTRLTTSVAGSAVILNWVDNANAANSFQLQRKTQSASSFTPLATVAAGVTSYSDTTTQSGTEYVYRVKAVSAVSNQDDSEFSNIALITRTSLGVGPAAFTALPSGPNQVTLTWTGLAGGPYSYEIERRLPNDGFWIPLASTNPGAQTFVDSSAVANTPYQYRVRGLSNLGRTLFSTSGNVNTPAIATGPTNLTITALSHQALRLNWMDNSNNELYFSIEYLVSGVWRTFDTSSVDTSQYLALIWLPASPATFRIRAKYPDGSYSAASNQVTVTIPPPQTAIPTAPSNFSTTAITNTQVGFTWQDNSNNESWFTIERKLLNQSDATYSAISFGPALYGNMTFVLLNTTNAIDKTVVAGTSYNYRVRAENEAGKSAPSTAIRVDVPLASSPSATPVPTATTVPSQTPISIPRPPPNLRISQ